MKKVNKLSSGIRPLALDDVIGKQSEIINTLNSVIDEVKKQGKLIGTAEEMFDANGAITKHHEKHREMYKRIKALEKNLDGILDGLTKVFTPKQFAKIGMDTDCSEPPLGTDCDVEGMKGTWSKGSATSTNPPPDTDKPQGSWVCQECGNVKDIPTWQPKDREFMCWKCDANWSVTWTPAQPQPDTDKPEGSLPKYVCPKCHYWTDRAGHCNCKGNDKFYGGKGKWTPDTDKPEGSWVCQECGKDWGEFGKLHLWSKDINYWCCKRETATVKWTPSPEPAKPDELKPCPLCGEKGLLIDSENDFGEGDQEAWGIVCVSCAVCTGYEKTPAEAITAWNNRPIEDKLRDDLADAEYRYETVSKALDDTIKERDAQVDEIERLKGRLEFWKKNAEEPDAEVGNLKAENEALLYANTLLKNTVLNDASFDLDELKAENAELRENCESLNKSCDAYEKENEAMKYNLTDALEARDKLQERQKWIDEVARPMHPDDERPWANEYITTRQALAKAQETIKRVREIAEVYRFYNMGKKILSALDSEDDIEEARRKA